MTRKPLFLFVLAMSLACATETRAQSTVPGIDWASFLGGSSFDEIAWPNGVTTAPNGDVIVTGGTSSADFPRSPRSRPPRGAWDAFVTRISADGTPLVWSYLLGGAFSHGDAVLAAHVALDLVVDVERPDPHRFERHHTTE